MKRVIIIFVVLVALLSTAIAWNLRKQRLALEAPPGSSGTIEGTRVIVASRLATRILAIPVQEGQRVQKGTLLVELDCADPDARTKAAEARVRSLQAQLEATKAQASAISFQAKAARMQAESQKANAASLAVQEKKAIRDSKRALSLQEQNVMDVATVENLQSSVDDASERLAASKAASEAAGANAEAAGKNATAASEQISAAERQIQAAEAELALAQTLQAECKVVAPTQGVVTVRAREPGEVVLPGTSLIEIRDDSEFKVKFYVTNKELGRVKIGMKVVVTADAFPDTEFTGEVVLIAEEAEFTPRNVQTKSDRDRLVYAVEARVQDKEKKLRAGMPVEARVMETQQ